MKLENESYFNCMFFLQWLDSRIQFNNIREDEFKNDVSAHKQEVDIGTYLNP